MANYLIVGASSGIGKQLGIQLSEAGHKVYGTYNKTQVSENTSDIEFYSMNVLEDVNVDFLPDSLEGLIYCPGTINLKPFTRIKAADFLSDFDLQVGGAVKVIQVVLPRLKAAGHSSIVLFSTVAVQTGLPFHTQVSASKGAIEGLAKSLAAEFAPKIRVNCIAPSLTDTPLASMLLNNDQKKEANAERHPLKRIGTTQDIANMAEFLVSDKASWITGQIMHVDGGMLTVKS